MEDRYYTIDHPAQHELKVKGSRFIGECALVTTTDDALGFLESIRKREHAATHHCYAYRVGLFDDIVFKYSDDGEPSGTAGRPIYDVICGHELEQCIIVVTRYFGGTKLGTGGLVRAYSETAQGVLYQAGRKEQYLTEQYRVEIDFSLYDSFNRIMHSHHARQLDAKYAEHVTIDYEIRLSKAEAMNAAIVQLSNGKAKIEKI